MFYSHVYQKHWLYLSANAPWYNDLCLLTFHILLHTVIHAHTFDGWSWLHEFGLNPLTRDEATSSLLYINTGVSPFPRSRLTLERVEGEPIFNTPDSAYAKTAESAQQRLKVGVATLTRCAIFRIDERHEVHTSDQATDPALRHEHKDIDCIGGPGSVLFSASHRSWLQGTKSRRFPSRSATSGHQAPGCLAVQSVHAATTSRLAKVSDDQASRRWRRGRRKGKPISLCSFL
jgi:hypothetical protein